MSEDPVKVVPVVVSVVVVVVGSDVDAGFVVVVIDSDVVEIESLVVVNGGVPVEVDVPASVS